MRAAMLFLAASACHAAAAAGSDPSADDLQIVRVRPSEADPAVKDFDHVNVIVTGRNAAAQAPLAIFLPGTGGRPENVEGLLGVVAHQGYRVIGLQYDDEPSVVQICPRQPDPDCSERFRRERAFGGDVPDAPVRNADSEAVVHRLVMLLRYLDAREPSRHWRDYLAGDEPDWSRIVLSGLSQGAGMAAYIAKQRPVRRVVLFSSPWDFYGSDRTLAPWLGQASRTPPERWFAEVHRRENTAPLIAKAYRKLDIPPDHVLVFDLDVPSGGRGQNPFHGSTVRLAGYAEQWRWLYGDAGDK